MDFHAYDLARELRSVHEPSRTISECLLSPGDEVVKSLGLQLLQWEPTRTH